MKSGLCIKDDRTDQALIRTLHKWTTPSTSPKGKDNSATFAWRGTSTSYLRSVHPIRMLKWLQEHLAAIAFPLLGLRVGV